MGVFNDLPCVFFIGNMYFIIKEKLWKAFLGGPSNSEITVIEI